MAASPLVPCKPIQLVHPKVCNNFKPILSLRYEYKTHEISQCHMSLHGLLIALLIARYLKTGFLISQSRNKKSLLIIKIIPAQMLLVSNKTHSH
jgi:hypothetical protein